MRRYQLLAWLVGGLIVLGLLMQDSRGSMVGKGSDGKVYISYDLDEMRQIAATMKAKDDEIARLIGLLEAKRKAECSLI